MIRSRERRIARIFLDLGGQLLQLVRDLFDANLGQALQAQFQDGAGLGLGQVIGAIVIHVMARVVDQPDVVGDVMAGQRRVISFRRASAGVRRRGWWPRFRPRWSQPRPDHTGYGCGRGLCAAQTRCGAPRLLRGRSMKVVRTGAGSLFGRPPFSASMLQPK